MLKKFKKFLAVILSFAMVISMLPNLMVFADNSPTKAFF